MIIGWQGTSLLTLLYVAGICVQQANIWTAYLWSAVVSKVHVVCFVTILNYGPSTCMELYITRSTDLHIKVWINLCSVGIAPDPQ